MEIDTQVLRSILTEELPPDKVEAIMQRVLPKERDCTYAKFTLIEKCVTPAIECSMCVMNPYSMYKQGGMNCD